MIIEYSNAKEPKSHTSLSAVIVIASCAFFFIPTTLIVLGYLASQPTGTLVSPLPKGTLSDVGAIHESPAPKPTQPVAVVQEAPIPTPEAIIQPIIAAASDATSAAQKEISQDVGNNIIDKTASISANLAEVTVTDADIKSASQIYLSPRPNDNTVYSVKSKGEGQMIVQVSKPSDTVRYVDYHIVNP